MEIILYSTHCPQCRGVESLLSRKNIPYTICSDLEEMKKLELKQVPVLSVDEQLLRGKEIYDWIHKFEA